MEDMLEFGRSVLATQPFCNLLGIELVQFEPGKAELRLVLKPEHLQQHGFAHGGIVAMMADSALAYAGGSKLGDSVTLEFKLNMIRPAIGETLIARGEALSVGKTQAVCRCEIFSVKDGEEKLCAAGQGTLAVVGKAK